MLVLLELCKEAVKESTWQRILWGLANIIYKRQYALRSEKHYILQSFEQDHVEHDALKEVRWRAEVLRIPFCFLLCESFSPIKYNVISTLSLCRQDVKA